MSRLRTDIDVLPTLPGVYLMKDDDGDVLYVGKAVDLRSRVRQYFKGADAGDGRFHILFLVPRIRDVDVVVTSSEREALILEDTLIKKYQPRYNVKLKDDKSWLSVRLPRRQKWPRVTLVRRWKDDGARYFGPYLDEVNARQVLKLLTRTVPLRTCSDGVFKAHSERPCIEYQMGRCSAPCTGYIDKAAYDELVDEAELLLEGRNNALTNKLTHRMEAAASELRFEEAARVRDSIRLIARLSERQSAQVPGTKDRDVFGLHREGELAAVALMPIREGRMQDARAFTFRGVAEDDGELLGRLITQLYSATVPPPPEILVPCPVADADLRAELLSELGGRKITIRHPQRGEAVRLLDISAANAKVRFQAAHSKIERGEQAMFSLQKALRLPSLPRHIEAYDNSNIQGTDPVGAMVTFRDGRAYKKGYRIFKIRTVEGADDYATMREVLGRRFKRAREKSEGWELPDLIVIDGGKGQLGMVIAACEDLGVDVLGFDGRVFHRGEAKLRRDDAVTPGGVEGEEVAPRPQIRLVSIAKPREGEQTDKLYEPGRSNAVSLRPRDPALQLLQQLRDESHRFGVSHHRKQRKKRTLRSDLDEIPGVGEALRRRLLTRFGSVRRLRQATAEEIAAVKGIGKRKAEGIAEALRGGGVAD